MTRYSWPSHTLRDPILTEQDSFSGAGGGAELEHAEAEGQSPQEQPNEVSPQEYVDTFIVFIPEESGAVDVKLIAYGDPGMPSAALLPINAYHSPFDDHKREQEFPHRISSLRPPFQCSWSVLRSSSSVQVRFQRSSSESPSSSPTISASVRQNPRRRIVESLRDEVLVVQQRLGRIEEATKKMNAFDHHSCVTVVKVVGVGVLVVLAAILCVNVMV
nr:uncharacterized protein LOC109147908 [Ipomoea batatas]